MTPFVSRARGAGGRTRATPEQARRRDLRRAVVAVLLIALCAYGAFVKGLPFGSRFVVHGVFASANELKAGNPVRVAGLPAGSVTSVSAGPHGSSLVTFALSTHAGLHADATLSIVPRLLFEGNFYVALDPGTPGAPPLRSGATIPLTRTTTPVQIDQLLDVLAAPTRGSLQTFLTASAAGLGTGDAGSAPGSADLRAAARELSTALPPLAQTATALQGVRAGDLTHAIASTRDTTAELGARPASLSDLVTSSARVLAALSSDPGALARTIAGLDRFTRVAPAALGALDGALPVVTAFAGALRPALHTAPPALADINRLFGQLHGLASRTELPRVVSALAPLLGVAPSLEARLRTMFPRLTAVNTCTTQAIVPALDEVLQDGTNTSGYPAWKDLLHLGAALSGASASFDGNGVALRIGVAEGSQTGSGLIPGFGELTGAYQGEGVRPQWLGYGVLPPFRPDQPCTRQPVVKVNP